MATLSTDTHQRLTSVTVRSALSSQNLTLQLPSTATVCDLKNLIALRLKLPPPQQQLLFAGNELRDGALQELGVGNHATITLVPAIRAGPHPKLKETAPVIDQSAICEHLKNLTPEQMHVLFEKQQPITITACVNDQIVLFTIMPVRDEAAAADASAKAAADGIVTLPPTQVQCGPSLRRHHQRQTVADADDRQHALAQQQTHDAMTSAAPTQRHAASCFASPVHHQADLHLHHHRPHAAAMHQPVPVHHSHFGQVCNQQPHLQHHLRQHYHHNSPAADIVSSGPHDIATVQRLHRRNTYPPRSREVRSMAAPYILPQRGYMAASHCTQQSTVAATAAGFHDPALCMELPPIHAPVQHSPTPRLPTLSEALLQPISCIHHHGGASPMDFQTSPARAHPAIAATTPVSLSSLTASHASHIPASGTLTSDADLRNAWTASSSSFTATNAPSSPFGISTVQGLPWTPFSRIDHASATAHNVCPVAPASSPSSASRVAHGRSLTSNRSKAATEDFCDLEDEDDDTDSDEELAHFHTVQRVALASGAFQFGSSPSARIDPSAMQREVQRQRNLSKLRAKLTMLREKLMEKRLARQSAQPLSALSSAPSLPFASSAPSLPFASSAPAFVEPDVVNAVPCVPPTISQPAAALTTLAQPQTQPSNSRCASCNAKLGLVSRFTCRCEKVFCTKHRLASEHACSFDYKSLGRQQLERDNPVVCPRKL